MKIKIYEFNTNELLASFEYDQTEQAYAYAKQMEELGIEIRMDIPSVNHSLGESLGMSESELATLSAAMDEEIASHGVCCGEEKETTETESEVTVPAESEPENQVEH